MMAVAAPEAGVHSERLDATAASDTNTPDITSDDKQLDHAVDEEGHTICLHTPRSVRRMRSSMQCR